MINKSIAYRISIYITLAVVCVFLAFIVSTYLFNRKILKQNIENKAITKSAEITLMVEKYIVSTQEIASNISEQILYYGKHQEAEILLMSLMHKYKFLNAVHVNIDSTFQAIKVPNYFVLREKDSLLVKKEDTNIYDCPNEKFLISNVSARGKPGWVEPFICPINNKAIASYFNPIYIINAENDTLIVGEVICELLLDETNEFINSIEIWQRGFAFLIAKNGTFITHPNRDWILNRNVFKLPSKIVNTSKIDVVSIFSNMEKGSDIVYPEYLDYEKSVVYFTPIVHNDWFITIVIPYNELYEPLYINTLKLLLISVLGILLIFFLVTFITNRLVEPLSDATSQLKIFSSYNGEIENNNKNEVKLVHESLNYLKSWYEQYKETQKLEKKNKKQRLLDLTQASEIQQGFINTDFEGFRNEYGIDLFALYKPYHMVSGDLFDYFFIDNENLLITIGDVSGKGIPAAIFMSVAQTIIKNSASFKKPNKIVQKANLELCTNNQHQFFLTLFIGVLNTKSGILNYCNAAHTNALIKKSSGEIVELNQTHGLPLGLYADKAYSSSKIELYDNDCVVLYTDGVSELQNANNVQFGIRRLKETLINSQPQNDSKEIVNMVTNKLENFKANTRYNDDVTLFVVKFNSKKKRPD